MYRIVRVLTVTVARPLADIWEEYRPTPGLFERIAIRLWGKSKSFSASCKAFDEKMAEGVNYIGNRIGVDLSSEGTLTEGAVVKVKSVPVSEWFQDKDNALLALEIRKTEDNSFWKDQVYRLQLERYRSPAFLTQSGVLTVESDSIGPLGRGNE